MFAKKWQIVGEKTPFKKVDCCLTMLRIMDPTVPVYGTESTFKTKIFLAGDMWLTTED